MLWALPGLGAAALALLLVASPYSRRLDRALSRIAFTAFDGSSISPNVSRERRLRAAAIGTPYREYAAKTYLYVAGAAVTGVGVGVYAGLGAVAVLRSAGVGGVTEPSDGASVVDVAVAGWSIALDGVALGVVAATAASLGAVAAVAVYLLRWRMPASRADVRRRQIDAGMPRMVAFVYALTRGGMAFPDVMRALSDNDDVFGEGATEIGTAVRSIDVFSVDLVTAVQGLSDRTPSDQFEQFTENLGSVLQSGRNISEFLREQYERYSEEAEEQQAEILELLATTAEIYVTTIVAGMLFLVTILLIVGLTVGDTLLAIQGLAYVALPVANLLFLFYLYNLTQPLRSAGKGKRVLATGAGTGGGEVSLEADGGYETGESRRNHARLRAHDRLRWIRRTFASPVRSVIVRPTLLLYLTVPIAVVVTAVRLPTAVADGSVDVTVLDDVLVQAVLFLTGTFAVAYEVSKRRFRRLEKGVPDFLERLASLNEAGIAVVSSFDRVRNSKIGPLDEEVERIWRDIQWGATVTQALERFERRVRAPSVTRVVTLITNAMRASNDIGPVLRIAAEQARSDQRLRRQRRQEMLTYLVVIYVSFVVFLIVILAIDLVLIPSLPEPMTAESGGAAAQVPGIIGEFGTENRDAYQLVFFHTAIVQSTLSGVVGGVMGGGTAKDGMKHATIMLSITYLVLAVLT